MPDIWAWENRVDWQGTTITVEGGTDGELVTDNLKDPRVGVVARATTPGGRIAVSMPFAGGINILGIFGGNLAEMTQVTLGLGTAPYLTDLWSTTIDVATEGVDRQALALIEVDPPIVASEASFLVTGGVPLEAGRVWVGNIGWKTAVGHIIGTSNWQAVDLSARSVTPKNGAFLIDRADRRRTFTPAYDALTAAEMLEQLYTLDVELGLARQLLFIPEPTVYPLQRWPILGYLRELPENAFIGYLRGNRVSTIVEAG